jgi:hypothetical protein
MPGAPFAAFEALYHDMALDNRRHAADNRAPYVIDFRRRDLSLSQ